MSRIRRSSFVAVIAFATTVACADILGIGSVSQKAPPADADASKDAQAASDAGNLAPNPGRQSGNGQAVKCGVSACVADEGCCVYRVAPFAGACAPLGFCPTPEGTTALGQVACSNSASCNDGSVCCHRTSHDVAGVIRSTCDLPVNCPGMSRGEENDYIACDLGPASTCPGGNACNVASSPVTRGVCAR